MKIEQDNIETFQIGVKETSKARIAANAKAFEILSSTLYSNAILAIVRELCANAKDSHFAAGVSDRPFTVQLPNTLDPRFVVRDFGVGMTHEFVMNNLNTYFESTKNDNNDELGGFGLGIKCPFSYASSFTISCYDGTNRRVYSFQIGSDGLPEIVLMAETPNTDDKGVEVSVPAKATDYDAFVNAIAQSVVFYDVRPRIIGMQEDLLELTKIYEGTDWAVYKHNQFLTESEYVEMGGVIYPVPNQALMKDHYTIHTANGINGMMPIRPQYSRIHRGYQRSQTVMVFKANIGDVNITPNREQLKMTPETEMFLATAKIRLQKEMKDNIQAKFDACTGTFWEVLENEFQDVVNTNVFLHQCDIDVTEFTYKGHNLKSRYTINIPDEIKLELYEKVVNYNRQVSYQNHQKGNRTQITLNLTSELKVTNKFICLPVGVMTKIPSSYLQDVIGISSDNITYSIIETDQISDVVDHFKNSIPDGEQLLIIPNVADIEKSLKDLMVYTRIELTKDNWYYSNYSKIEQVFNDSDFKTGEQVVYSLSNTDRMTKLKSFVQTAMYYDHDFKKLIEEHNMTLVIIIDENVKARLEKNGVTLVNLDDVYDDFILGFAKMYASRVPELGLCEFVKPLKIKYKDISETTFIKAIKRWARECDRDDVRQMILQMEKEEDVHYRHRAAQPFKDLTQIDIEDYIKSKKITRSLAVDNQFVTELATHAPLAAMLVRNYANDEVCAYVKKEMAALKKPKKKKAKSS